MSVRRMVVRGGRVVQRAEGAYLLSSSAEALSVADRAGCRSGRRDGAFCGVRNGVRLQPAR